MTKEESKKVSKKESKKDSKKDTESKKESKKERKDKDEVKKESKKESKKEKKTEGGEDDALTAFDYDSLLKRVSLISNPMAGKKLAVKLLRTTKKGLCVCVHVALAVVWLFAVCF